MYNKILNFWIVCKVLEMLHFLNSLIILCLYVLLCVPSQHWLEKIKQKPNSCEMSMVVCILLYVFYMLEGFFRKISSTECMANIHDTNRMEKKEHKHPPKTLIKSDYEETLFICNEIRKMFSLWNLSFWVSRRFLFDFHKPKLSACVFLKRLHFPF